jgi:uncharacterized membrane protein YecN with MAPEG domain
MPHISALFAGLFIVVQIPLTVVVGYRRAKTGIQFFDEGDVTLRRRMRAHANFTETVPIVLIAMLVSEQMGAPAWLLLAGGGLLACGRALHYATLVRSGFGIGRAIGMVLTLVPMAGFGAWLLSR